MEKPRDARLVSRVFAAPRSQSWAKTRHVISGAIQEVQWLSRLSKHIYLRGKDLFVNLWIDASPIWNEMYLKEKRILSKTKVVCNTKLAFALRLRVLILITILKCIFTNVPKNLLIICPHPAPHHWAVLFSLSGWSAITKEGMVSLTNNFKSCHFNWK